MALIKCPECGQEISDKAKMCPHCGFELHAAENAVSPQQENKPAATPATEPKPATATTPATAEKAPAADAPKDAEPEIPDAAALWRKDCRGEYIFGWVYNTIGALVMIAGIVLFFIWILPMLRDMGSTEELAKNFVEYYQRAEEALIIGMVAVLTEPIVFSSLGDLWKPYRVLAWARRTNFQIRYYGKHSFPKNKLWDFQFYKDLQYISGSAQNSFRYRLWKVADGILSACETLMVVLGLVLGIEERLKGALFLLEMPTVPTIMWALPVSAIAFIIVSSIIKSMIDKKIKNYISDLEKAENAENAEDAEVAPSPHA